MVIGHALRGLLTLVRLVPSTTDICIPSIIFGVIFGFPPKAARES